MFRVLKKIGLSNFVAFLSLVVSIFAFWESHMANKPMVSIKDLPVYSTGTVKDKSNIYLHLFRFLISNTGGRAVSLNTISLPKQIEPVLGTSNENRVAKPIGSVKFFKINTKEMSEDKPYLALLDRSPDDYILQREDYILKKKLEPGETAEIYIGIEYLDLFPEIAQLLLSLDANLSDGTVIPIRAAIAARIERHGR